LTSASANLADYTILG